MKLKIVLALLVFTVICHTAGAVKVDWYQLNAKNVYEKVNFVVPYVKYKVVIHIPSSTERVVKISLIEDVPYWFDKVLIEKTVKLSRGDNEVELQFVVRDKNIRGVFVKIDGLIDSNSIDYRLSLGYEIPMSSYYFACLDMYVNGNEYDPDSYALVPSHSNVMITGLLIGPDGDPVPNFKVEALTVTGDVVNTKTTDSGSFTISWRAPDWSIYGMCNKKVELIHLKAIDSDGTIVAVWDIEATCVCEEAKPKAKFKILSVKVVPDKPVAGKELDVIAVIQNVGDTTETDTVIALLDNINLGAKKVTLKPGEKKVISWWYIPLYSKPYTITVVTSYDTKKVNISVGKGSVEQPIPINQPVVSKPSDIGIYAISIAMVVVSAIASYIIIKRRV